jgi:ATP phosphoribosyltransferase
MCLKIILPKGRMFENIRTLLSDAGYEIKNHERDYRPKCNYEEISFKMLKPQNIAKLVELGQHDVGFTGFDWITEKNADVVEVLDLGFDPVSVVSAAPIGMKEKLKDKKIIVASEYPNITKKYLDSKGLDYIYLQSYGATEVFPPEDADMIVDNTSSGKTLKDNKLEILDVIMKSSTRMIVNKEALKDPKKKKLIEEIKMMIESALIAREKIMIELNVDEEHFADVVKVIPCMKSPTINKLHDGGYAVKSVVPTKDVAKIIPKLKAAGATDILEYKINRVVI